MLPSRPSGRREARTAMLSEVEVLSLAVGLGLVETAATADEVEAGRSTVLAEKLALRLPTIAQFLLRSLAATLNLRHWTTETRTLNRLAHCGLRQKFDSMELERQPAFQNCTSQNRSFFPIAKADKRRS